MINARYLMIDAPPSYDIILALAIKVSFTVILST